VNFDDLSRLASMLSKHYARDLLRMLAVYRDLSASEAASRLDLHIKTVQDFLETLVQQGIAERREARDRRRPYYRYTLKSHQLVLNLNLRELADRGDSSDILNWKIRERKSANALFQSARKSSAISAVHLFGGTGRNRTERKIMLTPCQGRFLFHLPFPTQPFKAVLDMSLAAGIERDDLEEVLDIIRLLERHRVIEKQD
jgi:DNA-binding MarR family transcriptional regulator